jgi:hypothetical protein
MVPLIAFICNLEPVRKRKKIFLFQMLDILQQCLNLNPNSYPNPNFFSDSDPAKTFGWFRIRIHNTGLYV